jgi:hypothetical protein
MWHSRAGTTNPTDSERAPLVAKLIKPIPTWYDGVLHRSGLEARYAVLFKELGIKADWEPQGFDADGTWYRPDFLAFPALGMLWAEVKPEWDNDPEGVARWRTFSLWRPMPSRSALLVGVPAIGNRPLVLGGDPEDENPSAGVWEDDTHEWRPCPSGHHFDLAWPGRFRSRFAEDDCPYTDQEGHGQDRLERAIAASRSERFSKSKAA